MKYEDTIPKNKEGSQEKEDSKEASVKLTDSQRGLISLGVVAGAIYAIHGKRSFWGILGFMWLGSIAGGGLGYLFKKKDNK